jgi:carbonic anhydrase
MESYKKLLLANKAWVEDKLNVSEEYFTKMADDQTPEFLWIGCADSRVPAEDVTGTEPGELFVHRNIANQVIHTDFNMLSVLQYAVEVLKVKHIIVCGHYGLINKWLRNIKDVYRMHQHELDGLPDADRKLRRLVELNVQEQVWKLAETSFVQHAWQADQSVHLHGWVYDLHTGLIKDMLMLTPKTPIEDIYKLEFDDLRAGRWRPPRIDHPPRRSMDDDPGSHFSNTPLDRFPPPDRGLRARSHRARHLLLSRPPVRVVHIAQSRWRVHRARRASVRLRCGARIVTVAAAAPASMPCHEARRHAPSAYALHAGAPRNGPSVSRWPQPSRARPE